MSHQFTVGSDQQAGDTGVQRAFAWVGIHLGRLALTCLPILAAGGVGSIWWNVAHNSINNDCNNTLYYAGHLGACSAWRLHDGIATAITVPLIAIGIFGTLGFTVAWLIRESEKEPTDPPGRITR